MEEMQAEVARNNLIKLYKADNIVGLSLLREYAEWSSILTYVSAQNLSSSFGQ